MNLLTQYLNDIEKRDRYILKNMSQETKAMFLCIYDSKLNVFVKPGQSITVDKKSYCFNKTHIDCDVEVYHDYEIVRRR